MSRTKRSDKKQSSSLSIFDQLSGKVSALLLIAAACFGIYGQSLSFTIGKFDEDVIITFNEKILKNSSNVIEVLKRDAFFNNPGRNFYRPVQNLSFFIDTQIGKGKSWAYYFTNILLHIATCWLLFLTLTDLKFRAGPALASTLFYAVSPIFVHAVAWAPGRGDLLIALFSLICLRAAFRYLDNRGLMSLVVLHGVFFLSMFSKETSVLIPVMIIGTWWLFYPNRTETRKTIILILLPCVIPVVLWFITRRMVIPKFPDAKVFGITPFLENLRVIPETIGKFIVPIGLAPLPAFSIIVTVVGIVVIVALLVLALRNADSTQRKLTLFGIAWFLLFTIPGTAYTNELGDIAYDYLEHRAYLPMIGIVFVLGVIISRLSESSKREVVQPVIILVVLGFGALSYLHAHNYKNPELFYDMAVNGNPNSGMSLLNRGYLKANKNDIDGALRDYTRAGEACPTYAEAWVNRGVLYQNMSRMTEAGNDFKAAVQKNPKLFAAQYNLANWYGRFDDLSNALTHYKAAMALKPTFAEGWAMTASVKAKMGDLQGALPDFNKALEVDPALTIVYVNRGKAFYNTGQADKACADWSRGSAMGNAEASNLLRSLCR
jgi:tetratricopeptide (TPR) repeat protein